MKRLRRALGVTTAAALVLTMTALAAPASASHIDCGEVITQSVKLDSDVGPCYNSDGLIVRASNITVDLNGHRVFAASPNGPLENVGIRLAMVSGVTVQNGTIEGFDAGVFINGGGNNVVQRLTVQNNINDMAEPYAFVPGRGFAQQPAVVSGQVSIPQYAANMLCLFGDGITTESSDNNLIQHNNVIGNGPYGGITLVGDSDANQVVKNQLDANNINNFTTRADGTPGTGLCGATLPGAPGMQRGREVQAIGIRLEGPGADNNVIEGNQVTDSALVGISIHSWVCQPLPGEPRPGAPNEFNLITKNRVSSTGDERRFVNGEFVSVERDAFADGIASLAQGPIGRVTCTSHNNTIVKNTSMDNDRHGIALHRTVATTVVNDNVANRNGGSGIFVAEGAVNNTLHANRAHQNGPGGTEDTAETDVPEFDGYDGNPNCDNNDWRRNRFLTVNQPCVAAGGTGWVGGPGRSGDAPGHQDEGDGPGNRPQRDA